MIDIWGDGESRREFMYAGDFAQIVPQVLEKFDEIPTVMNIGLGHDFTINEYYEMVAKVIGVDVEFTHDLTKPSGISINDCEKLHRPLSKRLDEIDPIPDAYYLEVCSEQSEVQPNEEETASASVPNSLAKEK